MMVDLNSDLLMMQWHQYVLRKEHSYCFLNVLKFQPHAYNHLFHHEMYCCLSYNRHGMAYCNHHDPSMKNKKKFHHVLYSHLNAFLCLMNDLFRDHSFYRKKNCLNMNEKIKSFKLPIQVKSWRWWWLKSTSIACCSLTISVVFITFS